MVVVDSSVIVEWLLGLPLADAVAQRLETADSIHAPALLDVEVAQVVRRYAAIGEINDRVAARAIGTLSDFDAQRHTHDLLLPLIWKLRHNLTAYDAAFVALAAVLDATSQQAHRERSAGWWGYGECLPWFCCSCRDPLPVWVFSCLFSLQAFQFGSGFGKSRSCSTCGTLRYGCLRAADCSRTTRIAVAGCRLTRRRAVPAGLGLRRDARRRRRRSR